MDYKVQIRVSLAMMFLGIIAFFCNLSFLYLVEHKDLLKVFFDYETAPALWEIIFSILICFITMFIDNKIVRILQSGVFIIVGACIIITSGLGNGYSFFILVVGVILFYRYSFFDFKIKSIILGIIVTLIIVGYLFLNKNNDSIFDVIKYLSFLLALLAIIYFVFEQVIIHHIAKSLHLEEKIKELEPVSKLGNRVSTIIHSLKNQVGSISNYIELMGAFPVEQDGVKTFTLKEAQFKRLEEANRRFTSTIKSSLYVTITQSTVQNEQVDLNSILIGIHFLFLGDNILPSIISPLKLPDEPIFVLGMREDIICILENVYTNAIEAIRDLKVEKGNITTILENDRLIIENNGGELFKCTNCLATNCPTECRYFKKRGHTTKSYGTGVGITSIFELCEILGWRLKITTKLGKTIYNFNFTRST